MPKNNNFNIIKTIWFWFLKAIHSVSKSDLPNKKRLYTIDYANVRMRFIEELKKYKNHPELIDITEFSMNYSFGYHLLHNIHDSQSREAMSIEVKNYLINLQLQD